MKIDDLILLLNNRLREFKLSRDYARMSGDLERMNVADKEILALEDTLYKLNLLVDTSQSAAVKEATLAEIITDGSVAVLGKYDIASYATDPEHEEKIMNILSKMGVMDTVEKIDDYIKGKSLSSPVTGEMVMSAALAYLVDARLMMAIMEQDSHFGTVGLAVSTLNPGNVGNDDGGNIRTYESWQEGVTAVAEWLSRHRGSTIISEIPEENMLESVASSTPSTITPIATSTPIITTSTTTTISNIPLTATSTPTTDTSTTTATTTPVSLAEAEGEGVVTDTSTTTTATSTPVTTTSTPTTGTSTTTTATSTPVSLAEAEGEGVVTDTSTTTDATTTPVSPAGAEGEGESVVTATPTTTTTSTDSTSSEPTVTTTASEAWQATTTEETATTTAN